ncbi:MAG: ATP-binding cassette subfamily B protein [Cognaticolwellia sp.]|jgi:ATP-binding cassette subfamily B protein
MAKRKEEKKSIKEQFHALKNLPKFFKMIWNTSKLLTIANTGLRLIRSLIPLAMLYIGKLLIDEVIQIIPLFQSGESLEYRYLWTLVAAELGLAIIADLISRMVTLFDSLLGDLFSNKISVRLIRHAARLDLYQFENPDFYDKLERARRQTVGRVVLMSQVLTQMQDIITIVSLGVGLVYFNAWLILILLIAVIPLFLGESHFNNATYSLSRSWTPERRELDYLRFIGASDGTAKEIKIFGLSDFIANRFKEISDKYYIANKKIAIQRAFWGILLSGVGTLTYYGAYIFIIVQTISSLITIGTLVFLSGSFKRMHNMMQGIMTRFTRITESALYLQDLFDFLAIEPQIKNRKDVKLIPSPIRQGFTFENVSFKYPETERWAIRNVSFHLEKDEKLALVGENGAGKTTLVKLLSRLYEPTEGRILLDGIDLKEYDLNDLRQNIGVIFQDYVQFQMSASDNIAIGKIENKGNRSLIEAAASKSLANTVIDKLPKKYDQFLGKRFHDGVELSGGEWQKIALARAYMRDAQLLILDEPTSALDARSEHEVFIRFAELIEDKAAVLISHRFSTVRMADRILLLENGGMKELGSHEELLKLNGKYAELFRLQAKGYQ